MAVRAERLPYGIGRFGPGWYAALVVLVAGVAWGLNAYAHELDEGLVVTGLRDVGPMGGAAWGLYITFVVYFVGVSFAGITVAALIRLLDLRSLRPVARMAELLTVVALVLAALTIVADLGQPLRGIVNLFLYARPQSPFFGTFTLVISGYLFASLVYLYLDARRDAAACARVSSRLRWLYRIWAAGYRDTPEERTRHGRASFFLALGIIPLLVTAHSTLGFVFGLQIGRPGWFSALQAPGFVVLAAVSGIGLLIVIAAVLRLVLRVADQLPTQVFRWLGNMLLVSTGVYLYFILVDWFTAVYEGQQHEVSLTRALLTGDFAWIYWLSVATLVVPFGLLLAQFITRRYSIGLVVLSGLLVNVAAVGKRYLIVVPSQIEGTLLPYERGSYSPTWGEYSVLLGLVALGGALYILFIKAFPIMETEEPPSEAAPAPQRARHRPTLRRAALTTLMVVTGFALQAVGYLRLGAPWGFPPSSPAHSNPQPLVQVVANQPVEWSLLTAPPAALVFLVGVMLVFSAAVVYELLPERRTS